MPWIQKSVRCAKLPTAAVNLSVSTRSNAAELHVFPLNRDRPLTMEWELGAVFHADVLESGP
jgi:energy-converting hydrogenase Eha subunit A